MEILQNLVAFSEYMNFTKNGLDLYIDIADSVWVYPFYTFDGIMTSKLLIASTEDNFGLN